MRIETGFMPICILAVWVVTILSIVLCAFFWFVWTWPIVLLIETVETTVGLPPEAATTVAFLLTVFMVLPILITLGLLLWAFVNSQRREDVTHPYGY